MSRIRANKITDKLGTGAIEIEKGAWFPVGYGLTGAGSVNITGVVTANSFSGDGSGLIGVASTDNIVTGTAATFNTYPVDINAGMTVAGVSSLSALTATTGGFTGGVSGTTGTFSGAVSGTTGTFSGAVSGTTGTFSGSVSVGGTLTYEDVVNVDSVGIVTARLGVRVPDNVYSYFGTGNDLSIRHDAAGGNHSYIFNSGAGVFKLGSNTQFIIGKTTNATYIQANPDGDVKLYFNNSSKLATSNTGVTVTGTVAATAFAGDGSALTNLAVGLATEALTTAGATVTLDLTKDDHKITKSGTYTITCTGGVESESHTLRIVNSGISTVGFSTYFLFPSGGTPNLPNADGAVSLISFSVHRAGAVGVSTQLLSGASVNFS